MYENKYLVSIDFNGKDIRNMLKEYVTEIYDEIERGDKICNYLTDYDCYNTNDKNKLNGFFEDNMKTLYDQQKTYCIGYYRAIDYIVQLCNSQLKHFNDYQIRTITHEILSDAEYYQNAANKHYNNMTDLFNDIFNGDFDTEAKIDLYKKLNPILRQSKDAIKGICNNITNIINKYNKLVESTGYNPACDEQPPMQKLSYSKQFRNSIHHNKEWQTIYQHGFSVNKMYASEANRIVRSYDYNQWINKMLLTMKKSHLKSLQEMNVNPNKPMKIEIEFTLVHGSDTDNCIKSFLDILVKYYKMRDDNNFVTINVSRNPEWARSYSDGKIKFRIENI